MDGGNGPTKRGGGGDEVERKIRVREAALAQISDDPARLLQRQAAGEQIEPEFYLSIAIVEWLPRRRDDPAAERALQILAKLFLERHRDPWARDALAAGRGRQDAPGFAVLAAGRVRIRSGRVRARWRRRTPRKNSCQRRGMRLGR